MTQDTSSLIIRRAETSDLRSLATVLVRSFYDLPNVFTWVYPLLHLGIYEDLRYRLKTCPPNYLCLVAIVPSTTNEREVVGTVELSVRHSSFWSNKDTQYPYISNLAVKDTHRRQGIGRKLLSICEKMALEWGFDRLYLHVLENNPHARQLYFTCGYKAFRRETSWDLLLFNYPQRLLLMKPLETQIKADELKTDK